MKMSKKLKRLKKGIPLSRNMTIVIVVALIVFGTMYVVDDLNLVQYNVYNTDNDTTRTTTTPVTTPTTTEPDDDDDEPPLPPGTWYHLQVMFVWADWVAPIDYRDMWIGVSDMAFVGIDDYRIDDGVWYEFDTFRVEEGAEIYISMMSIIDPIDMTFSYETELDYNIFEAGPWSGTFTFRDTSMPMLHPVAGSVMYSWVLL